MIVSNYTNKHLTFHKGEYLRCLGPLELDPTHQEETHQANTITLKKMMAETVTSDTFNPLCHEISTPIHDGLNLLLEEYASQFAQDETSIGTTPLTSMSIDTDSAEPVSQKTIPHCNETLRLGQEGDRKIIGCQGDSLQLLQLVSPHHHCSKG